jgi:4-diphosphocytidyl-2-C-methyl-D-erythritol kinase
MNSSGHKPVISERARAKVNLTLRVLGRRADGYHELESLVAFADVADAITLDLDAPVSVSVGGPFGPSIAGENLVRVTLDRLTEFAPRFRLGAVRLDKHLPVAAGIGGGSSDAAAVLRAVKRANPELADTVDWLAIAAKLGADVPVCFNNGPAMMRGTGEQLQPLDSLPPLAIVLVNPQVPVPADKTARVFRTLGAKPLDHLTTNQVHREFETRGELLAFMTATGNDLLIPALQVVPEIGVVMDALKACDGVGLVALSGGGPTCFAVFSDEASAGAAATRLRNKHPTWWVEATALAGTQSV